MAAKPAKMGRTATPGKPLEAGWVPKQASPPPAPARAVLGLGFAIAGTGVAGLAVGGVFGYLAIQAKQQQVDKCPSSSACPDRAGASAAHESAVTKGTISTIAFVAGALATTVGIVLVATDRSATHEAPGPKLSLVTNMGPSAADLRLAVDASYVYASVDDSGGSGTGSIVKVPIAGGSAVTLASGQLNNGELAIDDTYVYWADLGDGTQMHNTDGSIMRVPKAGGSVVTLAANVDGPRSLVLANNFVYFGNWDSIQKVPTTTGAVSTVTTTTGATVLAADASSIYAGGTAELSPVLQLSFAGVEQSTLAATGNLRSLAVDGGMVFWSDLTSLNSIAKMP
jgi:hypothetical protein